MWLAWIGVWKKKFLRQIASDQFGLLFIPLWLSPPTTNFDFFFKAKTAKLKCKDTGGFHLYLFSFDLPFNYIANYQVQESVHNQSKISWYGMILKKKRPFLILSFLRFSKMTSELITFNHLRCHSSSTALGTRTGYWKPTRRGTDETPHCTVLSTNSITLEWFLTAAVVNWFFQVKRPTNLSAASASF